MTHSLDPALHAPIATPSLAMRYLRVDHAGEFGAIQIYRAQILIGRWLGHAHVALLEDFLAHERRHLATFAEVLAARGVRRCRSFLLCGVGGYALGLITALLGERAVMACTRAVETVVNRHLQEQLVHLADTDPQAHAAVASIVRDELGHRDLAAERVGADSALTRAVEAVVAMSTESVIWLGLR
ncbi:demethoxyubiquinone hydroxylase family protein [Lysobacter sp. cf310]|uniref:demethoxyubiquinone hydroxylase family protein n=1 Tax=Lysobacter sp. cf310 TaxID=1761790 RepID=UPI000B82E19B|nr:demethoxyubiquinone hydroxylase family protein [Lysobacter sp. cf310]